MGLVLVRVVMGFADGAYTPASISATMEASPPARHGRNIGIQQMTLTLFGLGLSPLIVSALLHVLKWRLIFSIFTVPGLILAALVWHVIPDRTQPRAAERKSAFAGWREVLGYSNIRICMGLMLCWLTCLITTSALFPSYLVDHLKLGMEDVSRVMSAIGLGSAVGTLLLPWLSDRIGRKPVMLLSALGTSASLIALSLSGPDIGRLFACLFMVHFFNNAAITLTVGPLCSETVPPTLMATASGVVIACGEFFGGGLAPILGAGLRGVRIGTDSLVADQRGRDRPAAGPEPQGDAAAPRSRSRRSLIRLNRARAFRRTAGQGPTARQGLAWTGRALLRSRAMVSSI